MQATLNLKIERTETGEFIGMVSCNSLVTPKEWKEHQRAVYHAKRGILLTLRLLGATNAPKATYENIKDGSQALFDELVASGHIQKQDKFYICPHKFGSGLKLMEFSNDTHGPLQALAILLSNGNGQGGGDLGTDGLTEDEQALIGSWAGDPVIVAGDYGEPWKFFPRVEYDGKTYETQETLYRQDNGRVGTADEVNGRLTPTGKKRTVTHTFGQRVDRTTGESEPRDENLYSLAQCFFEDISDKIIRVVAIGEGGCHPWAAIDLAEDGWRHPPAWGVLPEKEPKKPIGGKKLYNVYKKHAKPATVDMADTLAHMVLRNPETADTLLALVTEKITTAKKQALEAAAERHRRGW